MFFPNIMYGLPIVNQYQPIKDVIPTDGISIQENYLEVTDFSSEKRKELELFSPEYIQNIEAMLQDSITLQLYLQVDCSLSQVSEQLRIPAHHLTYYFNNIKKESFSNWRNNLRVAYAIRILSDDTFNQLTIEGIGEKVGFKSYSTFIRSFKKVTRKTPSDYIENRS